MPKIYLKKLSSEVGLLPNRPPFRRGVGKVSTHSTKLVPRRNGYAPGTREAKSSPIASTKPKNKDNAKTDVISESTASHRMKRKTIANTRKQE
jgi:hypothetical protein